MRARLFSNQEPLSWSTFTHSGWIDKINMIQFYLNQIHTHVFFNTKYSVMNSDFYPDGAVRIRNLERRQQVVRLISDIQPDYC